MMLRRFLCGVALSVVGPSWAACQDYAGPNRILLPSESTQVRNRLRAIDRLLEPAISPSAAAVSIGRLGLLVSPMEASLTLAPALAERAADVWKRAEEAYSDLQNDAGDMLVPLGPTPGGLNSAATSLQVRRLCHLRLAGLPRSTLAAYRRRVEAEASHLFELSRKHRDAAPLRRIVEDLFCSSRTPAAIDLLGDLAFERGDFDEARSWWRRLAPLPVTDDAPENDLFPLRWAGATRVDGVRVQAKQILALAFEGSLAQAQDELARFHRRYPEASGTLAGRDGRYSDTVHLALQRVIRAGIANNADPWTTYGGAPNRNQVLTVCPSSFLWEDGATWRVALPSLDPSPRPKDKITPYGPDGPTRRMAFHPIVFAQQVLLADADSVTSYQLTTGKRLFRYDLKGAGLTASGFDARAPLPRFTLTAGGDCVYARLGRQRLAPRRDTDPDEPTYLVCLDLTNPTDSGRPREKWHIASRPNEFFEGAPLVHAGRSYVAMSRLVNKRVVTAVQCYDALGRLRWSSDICDIPEFEDSPAPRYHQHLLTWTGNQIVYCTHTGAVAAVDSWTGQVLWTVRYASRGPNQSNGEPSPRDLAPCIHDNGRLFVAPLDSDRLYCLEACTGRLLWERDGLDIAQLFGAANGRLLLATRHGVHALNTATGLTLWQQPSEGRLGTLGRGLVAGSWLLWPTQDAKLPMRAVTLAEGRQEKGEEENPFAEPRFFDPTQLRPVPVGNLAFGCGCLVVAGADELVAFVPATRQPQTPAQPDQRLQIQVRRNAAPSAEPALPSSPASEGVSVGRASAIR
jgi:cellulose synthase operon protein C